MELRAPPVVEPGLYDMSEADYHADPCPVPSLNHTVAKILHDQSPLHAHNAHPRLGGKGRTPTRDMTIGSAVHALAIGKGAKIVHLPYDDFRKKAAQEERDAHLAAGVTPLLTKDFETAQRMWPLMRAGIEEAAGAKIDTLLRETVAIAKDGEAWSRSMIDVMTHDLRTIVDAKTTVSAEPGAFGRYAMGAYATAVAFYFQTLDLIDPEGQGKRRFIFVAQERDTPEAITFHELDGAALEIGEAQMTRARLKWTLCSHTNSWPGYDKGPHKISPRSWDISDEYNRAIDEGEIV